MPAAFRALKAVGGARNWYCLGWGVPPVVIAVSRLTIMMSAPAYRGLAGLSMVVAAASSFRRNTPSKCTSPPKTMVTGFPLPGRLVVGGAALARADRPAALPGRAVDA